MKIVHEFNLPEDELDYLVAVHAREYYLAIEDIRSFVRQKLKYSQLSAETEQVLSCIKAYLPEDIS